MEEIPEARKLEERENPLAPMEDLNFSYQGLDCKYHFDHNAGFFEGENAYIEALQLMLKGAIDAEVSSESRGGVADFSAESLLRSLEVRIKDFDKLKIRLEVENKRI